MFDVLLPCSIRRSTVEGLDAAAETRKAKRRADLLQSTTAAAAATNPWARYLKGKPQGPAPERPAPPSIPQQLHAPAIATLRKDFDALAARVEKQDGRMEGVENRMESNRHEVMNALRALVPPAEAPETRKRTPEMPNTPLRLQDGRHHRDQPSCQQGRFHA